MDLIEPTPISNLVPPASGGDGAPAPAFSPAAIRAAEEAHASAEGAAVAPNPEQVAGAGACRFCGTPLRFSVVDLGMAPPCQNVVREEDLHSPATFYPLHALVCEACYLVQISTVVPPEDIFSEYAYFSSISTSWLAHAERYAEEVVGRIGLTTDRLVVELASNDGYLLQHFVKMGIPALGVEPAANVAAAAKEKGSRPASPSSTRRRRRRW